MQLNLTGQCQVSQVSSKCPPYNSIVNYAGYSRRVTVDRGGLHPQAPSRVNGALPGNDTVFKLGSCFLCRLQKEPGKASFQSLRIAF